MNPGKIVVGIAAILALCPVLKVRGQAITGFNGGTNWSLNAASNSQTIPTITNNTLFVASNIDNATAAFFDTPVYIGNFTASFVFVNLAPGNQEGFSFTIQDEGTNAVAEVGGNYLGYVGITPATGIAFDIATQGGRGPGIGYDPQSVPNGEPTAYTKTAPVDFTGTDPIAAYILYTNNTISVTVTDLVTSNSFSTSFTANIPIAVGTNVAFVGITGGGTGVLNLAVSNFVFNSVSPTQNGPPISQRVGLTNLGIADVSRFSGNEDDPVIAVNPLHPNQLFMAANMNASGSPSLFAKYSINSGTNWTPISLANIPAGYNPTVAWDGFGNLFLGYADGNFSGVDLAYSANGGQTFTLLTNLATNDYAVQQRIAVGPGSGSGSLWMTYKDYSVPNSPLFAIGMPVLGFTNFGVFGAPEPVTGATNDAGFGDITIGAVGQVMVVYQNNGDSTGAANVYSSLDPDGFGTNGFGTAKIVTGNGIGGNTLIPAAPDGQGINSSAGVVWDTGTGNQHFGRAYMVYTGMASGKAGDLAIYMSYSDNAGTSWSSPSQVNDDFTQNSKFMPRLALDPTDGAVAITWYDCRNDKGMYPYLVTNLTTTNVVTTNGSGMTVTNSMPLTNVTTMTNKVGTVDAITNDDAELFFTVTVDGGESFAENQAMTTNASESFLALNPFNYGDYIGVAMYGGAFYPVWADNSADFPITVNPDGPTNKFDIAQGAVNLIGIADVSLTVALTNTPNPLTFGSLVDYVLTVSNLGPGTAPSISFSNIVSPMLQVISASPSTNSYVLNGNKLTWPVGTLASGSNATILIRTRVIGLGNITNFAGASSSGAVDLFTNNNISLLVTPDDSPDLSLTMTGSLPLLAIGSPPVVFTMTASELQPVIATNVTITDTLPPNLTLTGLVLPSGTTVHTNSNIYTFQFGNLTNGQTISASMIAVGNLSGFATNRAVAADQFLDPVTTNNSASAVTHVLATYVPPVFALGITASVPSVGGDQQVVYTYNITNIGTLGSPDVLLASDLSSNLSYVGASLANISNGPNQNFELFDLGSLAIGQSTSMTITAAGAAVGQAISTAVVSDNLGEGAVTNQIVTSVIPPTLTAYFTGNPSVVTVGQTFTNTLVIENSGTVPANSLTVSESLSTNLALDSMAGGGISGNLASNNNSITLQVPELDPGNFTQITITATGLSLGPGINSALVNANFSTGYTPSLITPVDAPDMSLSMTSVPPKIPLGQTVTYNLAVKNLGPVIAYGVVVTDTLPAGVTFSSVTMPQGTYSNILNVVYCNVGTVATNQTVNVLINAMTQTMGKLTNTGYVSANIVPDPNTTNNSASVSTTVTNATEPYNVTVVSGVTGAFITWDTAYPGTDQVDYGLTAAYGNYSILNTNLKTHHIVLLSGLVPDTNYYFQARSVMGGVLGSSNSMFSTSTSLILITPDAYFSGIWTADSAATNIYPTNVPNADYSYSVGTTGSATASATFLPNFGTPGFYSVYIWFPMRSVVATNTPVLINGQTNATYAVVDETANPGTWQLLASDIYYGAGANGSVVIYNNIGSTNAYVLANAIEWVYDVAQNAPTNGAVPAFWSSFYFGGNVSGSADADGDGYSNYAEYVLGTDPTSAASALQFSLTQGAGTNTVAFSPYQGGRVYQLLSSTNLLQGWQALTNTATSTTNGTGYFSIPGPTANAVFYQLSVSVAPQ